MQESWDEPLAMIKEGWERKREREREREREEGLVGIV